MLTKFDLQAIDKIVKKRIREEIEAESENLKTELQADIKMALVRVLSETNNIKDRLKDIEITIRKIKKDLKITVNFFDNEELRIQKRVERIKEQLNIPPLSN